ncbi:MAG: DUF4268 domain-containing protein [Verrucomicrobia bacterium]|nr:DUF4268 domain-containing protein [Verrucomicrobiota bacterium]MCH8511227.1 DUF4268 domain-containing protein [Kiritimatiellia bacterium]
MYKIDKSTNRIQPLDEKSFGSLGFTERHHLQEWLAHAPQALGEDLLILQKEFDGFDDTRERLDLLALDKDGNLVIIENKLDDSGRDVVWQGLKYAGYCSNLSKGQVVEIYQQFLNKEAERIGVPPADAKESLVEFLDAVDFAEVSLNKSQSQRMMFVAAKFRKEVTNTALWLIGHGISCQCFKVTPYLSGDELFLNVEQIIPTPESEEFMIGMAAKEAEEKAVGHEVKKRHRLRLAFWEQLLDVLKGSPGSLFDNISPGKDNSIGASSGLSGVSYNLVFGKKAVRVEVYLSRASAEENTFLFDYLHAQKDAIEAAFGKKLDWQPLSGKKTCRICHEQPFDGFDPENWAEIIQWFNLHVPKLEQAFKGPISEASHKLKTHSFASTVTHPVP